MPTLPRFHVGSDAGTDANPLPKGSSFFFVNNLAVDIDVYRNQAQLEQPGYVVPAGSEVRVDIQENATTGRHEYIPVLSPSSLVGPSPDFVVANPKIIIQ